jgi:MFS superfamily sulfate permease-like transporter
MFEIYSRQININLLNEKRFKQRGWVKFKKWITACVVITIAATTGFSLGIILGSFFAIAPIQFGGVLALTLSSARYFR